MHVLFFNRSYAPDATATGQLLATLAESLVRDHGYRVTVVTGPLAGVARRADQRGVQVIRTAGLRLGKARFAGRAANYVSYFLSACVAGLRVPRPDVVVAMTDPPIIGLCGWLSARRFRAPLVMHYQDIFPEVATLLEDFRSPLVNRTLQRVNEFLVRRAARVIALGDTMRKRLIEGKGAPAERVVVIPNYADTHAIVPGSRDNAFARRHGLTDHFVVMHSGNIGLSQSLDTLVEAAGRLRDERLVVVFQGDGVRRPALEAQVQALGLGNVRFLPYATAAELSDAFATADLFVISLKRGLAGYIVPSKLYGILAAGRPFVAAVEAECEVADVAQRFDCGVRTEPGDAAALADAIRELAADKARREAMGRRAREAGLTFDRSVHVDAYARVLHSVVPHAAAAATRPAAREI